MAGGTLVGGYVVALMTLGGQLSANSLFLTSSGLFVIGAVLGLFHGGALGYLGRPSDVSGREALGSIGRATLYTVPALVAAWLLTVWISMTVIAVYLQKVLPFIGVGLAWLAGLALVATATIQGWRALGNAYARWPERHFGTVIVAGVFAALMVTFLSNRPELWGIRLRFGWRGGADIGVGLAAGLIVGLVAAPFAGPALAPAGGSVGMILHSVSHALVDEVLLRLILLTSVAWVLLRWHKIHPEEAAVASVIVVAILQVFLYTPGLIGAGFPSAVGGQHSQSLRCCYRRWSSGRSSGSVGWSLPWWPTRRSWPPWSCLPCRTPVEAPEGASTPTYRDRSSPPRQEGISPQSPRLHTVIIRGPASPSRCVRREMGLCQWQ
jgi:hypothetical protein